MSISPRELLHRLFVYIEEQLKDIDPRAFQIGKSALPRLFPKDLADLPGVCLDVQEEGDHVWLKVERLEEVAPPAPDSERFSKAIRVDADPNGKLPQLIEAALDALTRNAQEDAPEAEHLALADGLRAEAEAALVAYVSKWQEWAAREQPRRKTISLYSDLFALRHQLHAEQTANPVEFVWGVGMASWKLNFEGKPFDFQYPLLTQPLEISLDQASMSLEVRPRATEPGCEMDGFVACGIHGASECEKAMQEHLSRHADTPVSPFSASSYADVLKLVARNLDSRGSYVEVLARGEDAPGAGAHLVVSDCWVLFTRPKSNNYLVADLKNIRSQLEAGCEIPDGPLALVTPPSDAPLDHHAVNFRGLSGRGASGAGEPKELYFPLPYNQEQVTIVQRLERAAGVTVQGPPGTGKTHTIANIICHYLATGKRVLVTSKGEPALEVLQGKIPKEVQPLTVALLAGDRDGIRQFQASIEAIQHQVSQLDPQATRDEIDRIHRAIDRTHHELVGIDRRVDEIAMQQLAETPVDGASYRAEELAELVVKGAPQHAWFDDELSLEPQHAPPLSGEEAARLREDRRQLGADLAYLAADLPSPDELPLPADIAHASLQAEVARCRDADWRTPAAAGAHA